MKRHMFKRSVWILLLCLAIFAGKLQFPAYGAIDQYSGEYYYDPYEDGLEYDDPVDEADYFDWDDIWIEAYGDSDGTYDGSTPNPFYIPEDQTVPARRETYSSEDFVKKIIEGNISRDELLDYYRENVANANDETWGDAGAYHQHVFNVRTVLENRYTAYNDKSHYISSVTEQLSCRCGELGEIVTTNTDKTVLFLDPHQIRNGRCIVCGYSDPDSGINEEQLRYYKELIYAIGRGEDPIKERGNFVYEMLARKLHAGGANLEQILKIIKSLEEAPSQYEYLYLLGLFNYNLDINGEKGTHYNGPWMNNTVEMTSECWDNFVTTFFHETGHATEINLWERKNEDLLKKFRVEDEIQSALTRDVENRIRDTIRKLYGNKVSKPEEDAVVKAFINGNEQEYEEQSLFGIKWIDRKADSSISYSRRLMEIYKKTRDTIEASMKDIPLSNASMVHDVYGGVTNNKIYNGVGHSASTTRDDGTITYYWWEDGKQTGYQLAEAWAEFFSAKITNNTEAIKYNQEFFPEATEKLQNLTQDLYEYYILYYIDIVFPDAR